MGRKAQIRHGSVSHRHLPRTDHLVTMNQTAHGTVTDRDQEVLGSDGRMAQDILDGLGHVDAFGREFRQRGFNMLDITMHTRSLAEQDFHRHIHSRRFAFTARDDQVIVFADRTQNGVRATFATAHFIKHFERFRCDCDGITFLRFVTPDFQRAHTGFFHRHLRQIEVCTVTGEVCQFRHRVRQASGTDVMDRKNRIVFTGCPATVDHFLCATFHFGITALNRVKVESFGVRTRRHGRSGTTAQTDAHARTAQADQERTRGQTGLVRLVITDVTDTACEHDGLVIAVTLATHVRFEHTEVTQDVRATEFIIKGCCAQRTVGHDGQSIGDTTRITVRLVARSGCIRDVLVVFPILLGFRQLQRRHRKAAKAGLRTCTTARSAFVTDFTAATRGGTRERRNGRRVVVGFDLEDRVGQFLFFRKHAAERFALLRARVEAIDFSAF